MRLAKAVGVSFAFPTQSLHLETVAEAERIGPWQAPSREALASAVHGFAPGGSLSKPDGEPLTEGYFASSNVERGAADADG